MSEVMPLANDEVDLPDSGTQGIIYSIDTSERE